jgi:hypothetical protein
VQANFREGSFSYDIVTRLAAIGQHLVQNVSVSDVVVVGALLVEAVRKARGRKPAKIVTAPEPQIVFHDGDILTVNVNVAQMFLNPTIREDVEGIVEPLKRPGIDTFHAVSSGAEATVNSDEVEYFSAPLADEQVLQDKIEQEIIEVLSPHFKEGNKWQFSLAGEGSFWARILDEEFLKQVATRAWVFASGDALRVDMRVRVTRRPDGKFDRLREIVRVVGKEPAPGEPTLFEQPPG